MSLHIGIDLGTSGCRAIAIDDRGTIVGEARTSLPPSHNPAPGHFEQDPQAWWAATLAVLDQLIPTLGATPVDTISVDGTSATLLLSDDRGIALTPALMYNDSRAGHYAAQIREVAPEESGAHGANASLAKLLWLIDRYKIKNNNKIHALHQADWISNRLGDRWGHSDQNNTLKMGYDPLRQQWPTWLHTFDLPSAILPSVHSPGTAYSTLSTPLSRRWKMDQPNPVQICSGTTDSVAAAIAAGLQRPGDAVTSLGTTLVLKILSRQPLFSPEYGIYSHRQGDLWLISGASNAGGGVILDHFTLEEINALSQQIDPTQPSGLDYYPLSGNGERFPYPDPTLPPRLTPRPSQPHLFLQGILEGLTRIEMEGYRLMTQLGAPIPTRIFSAGGGTQNRAWMALRKHHSPWPLAAASRNDAAYGVAKLAAMHP